jgi:O-antigen/teichoic acid export membrane protein
VSDLRTLWKQTSHYLLGRAGLMLLGLVSFPLLARLLSVKQYGELSLLLKLAVLWTVLSKAGLQNAALRFAPEAAKTGSDAYRACVATLVSESCVIAGVMSLLGYAVLRMGLIPISRATATLVPVALALVFVRSIQPVLSGILRSEGRTVLFNICELLGKSLGISLSVAALAFVALDLHYYVFGLLIAEGSIVAGILLWFRARGYLQLRLPDMRLAARALAFSAPLIAYEIASVILDSGDRVLIGHYLGLAQVGFYSAAYSIATYAEEVLMTPVNMALFPMYMKIWVNQGAEDTARFLSRSFDIFFTAACGVLLMVLLTAHDLITLLASRKFSAAGPLLPVLVAGLLIYALHIFFNAPLLIYRRSMVLTAVTMVCCAANVGLNILLLPRMGIMGAAVATLVSYLALVVGLAVASRRYLAFRIPVTAMATGMVTASVAFAICLHISAPHLLADIALKSVSGLGIYALGLCVARPDLRVCALRQARRWRSGMPLPTTAQPLDS